MSLYDVKLWFGYFSSLCCSLSCFYFHRSRTEWFSRLSIIQDERIECADVSGMSSNRFAAGRMGTLYKANAGVSQ